MANQYAPDGRHILVDNVRFVCRAGSEDVVPANPLREPRLSFPLGKETFGVVPAVIHVVDDGDAEFSVVGDWMANAASAASYQGDRHTVGGNDGSAIATWRFENLRPRVYEVQATWDAEAGNATNAPYELFDDTTSRSLTRVDQSQDPSGSEFDDSMWQTIGLARVESGTLVVELSNDAVDNTVVADGVRIVPTTPPDQAIRNLTTIYESSLTAMSLLRRGTPEDIAGARLILNTMLYALEHDNTAGDAELPTAPDGSRGLRDGYASGDIAWFNDQDPNDDGAKQGEVRLSGFTSDPRLCGPSEFCLVLDGAFGGNNAFGIMALMSAYFQLGEDKYLDGAREISNWIYGNLADRNRPFFDPDVTPGATTFGGYFLGYPDQGETKVGNLIVGGLPNGIAWEFTAQVVLTTRFVDSLYGVSEFESEAAFYLNQLHRAQAFAPFGDGRGLVGATLDGENDNGGGHDPLDQCLGTPFQCIAERVGLAATNWAIYADRNINVFAPYLRGWSAV